MQVAETDEGSAIITEPGSTLLFKATVTAILVAVLAVLHWSMWLALSDISSPFMSFHLFQLGDLHISLTPIFFDGPAFSAIKESTVVWGAIKGAFALLSFGFFVAVIALVPTRYKSQLIGVSTFAAANLAESVEKTFGGQRVYFDVSLDPFHWPAFNIYGVVGFCAVICLYVFAALLFFRVMPGSSPGSAPIDTIPTVTDPLYEKRRPLKVLLSLLFFVAFIWIVLNGIITWIDIRSIATAHVIFADVSVTLLTSAFMTILPLMLLWRAIPIKRIDVLYLRTFISDKRSWGAAKRLRKGLAPTLRLAGVADPKEARRWFHLLYWLWAPFIFALGDFSRINVTRHNLFLEGDWKAGIRTAFSGVHAAVFDCRMLSLNLAWEITAGIRILGPKRMFFIITANASLLEIQQLLTSAGLSAGILDAVPQDNFVSTSNIPLLVTKIHNACA